MPSFLDQLVGTKPTVPNLPTLDLGQEQLKSIAANKAALPSAEELATSATAFNEQQITQMLKSVIPNFDTITANISKNIASETAGQIPTDVIQQITQSDAARALTGGFSGTALHGGLVAKDLGLTSLALTNQGLSSAESWLKTAASLYEPGIVNVSSMFISPQQMAAFDVEERNAQFQKQWMENQIAALPAPWAEDLKQFVYRAMSAYGGTPVKDNPYSTPGSFGGGGGFDTFGGGGGAFGGSGFDQGTAGAGIQSGGFGFF